MNFLTVFILSFITIFTSELPDKTAIALVALSIRHKAAGLILGAWLAFAIQTTVGVLLGSILLRLPQKPVHFLSAAVFIVFAILVFKRNEKQELKKEEQEVGKGFKHHRKAFLISFLVIFTLEWGDLSQMATAFLVAKTGNPLPVGMGAILALWTVAGMAIILGKRLSKKLDFRKLNLISAIILLIIGLAILASLFKT
ncbi:TMEM165/GDT1 family protein [Patescibacteria group bacterium]|nr:TMEM165/GDT1 family protein [Patescibacteria group bacterium]MCL5010216.1 TMEM165/GDT1 family protein [Patescibacteria group bacterium]